MHVLNVSCTLSRPLSVASQTHSTLFKQGLFKVMIILDCIDPNCQAIHRENCQCTK